MKEISVIIENPITTSNYLRFYPISKRWKKVSKLSHPNNHKELIETRISQYESVLRDVKELFANSGEICYERNFKDDNENPFTIYSFLTSTFWWEIECDFCYQINIVYQFQNCPYEAEIRALFKTYHLTPYITEVAKQPSLAAFYKAVLACQKPQFIHTL
jgi:hypothetical protein